MDIKELKSQVFDLIREVENLKVLQGQRVEKINELSKQIADLELKEKEDAKENI